MALYGFAVSIRASPILKIKNRGILFSIIYIGISALISEKETSYKKYYSPEEQMFVFSEEA
jgi:hypothetical protein